MILLASSLSFIHCEGSKTVRQVSAPPTARKAIRRDVAEEPAIKLEEAPQQVPPPNTDANVKPDMNEVIRKITQSFQREDFGAAGSKAKGKTDETLREMMNSPSMRQASQVISDIFAGKGKADGKNETGATKENAAASIRKLSQQLMQNEDVQKMVQNLDVNKVKEAMDGMGLGKIVENFEKATAEGAKKGNGAASSGPTSSVWNDYLKDLAATTKHKATGGKTGTAGSGPKFNLDSMWDGLLGKDVGGKATAEPAVGMKDRRDKWFDISTSDDEKYFNDLDISFSDFDL